MPSNNLAQFRRKLAVLKREYPQRFRRAVKAASQDMIAEAAGATPPLHGEDRGKNTVTGNLAAHWKYEINEAPNETRVSLINDLHYASYVDQGHRMDQHFVPWLYIDGMGSIARHIPEPGEALFGLVVGTKTAYVEGYGMADKAKDRFVKALRAAHDNLTQWVKGHFDGDN
jgi:hypothetical protein